MQSVMAEALIALDRGACGREVKTFLSLPREIRDQIYSLVFQYAKPIYPSRKSSLFEYLGLLRVNRQIYVEAISILYGSNIFQIRGSPSFMAVDFLNLMIMQSRESYIKRTNDFCQARFHLRRLYIPSNGINLKILKHIFSLLKYFPNLEYLHIVFLGAFGLNYIDVVNICRLLMDRIGKQFKRFVLLKRTKWLEAEDISWMVTEKPYKQWIPAGAPQQWKTEEGQSRVAKVVQVPQDTCE